MRRVSSRTWIQITIVLLSLLLLISFSPSVASASELSPLQVIPGWLQDMLDQLEIALVKTLQDSARVGAVLLWGILKLCGLVGLLADDFSALFGTVVTEALNAVITGSLHDLIRGSLMVSLGLFGLSLLARPFWPDLKLVSFQRAAIWGVVIQGYLLNAPAIYTELESWRVGLSEQVAGAVSSGAVPGCSGDVVEVLLCITGTSPAEVLAPSLTALPDQIPYGGSESVHDLYNHCVYNPPVQYGALTCNSFFPVGDPWQVLVYAEDGLGTQLLGLVLGLLILAYGILQISLGLSAGMMFVLFPVAAIFAFYLPLESFPAGVIRNYVHIFLKSIVLLTLAGVVIRLFSVAGGGGLAAMAAVALVDLLLCLVMAKEALTSLLSSVGFIGGSVATLGAAVGLSGGSGGSPGGLPSAESRTAAAMLGGGALAQAAMGAPNPYQAGASGGALGAPGRTARAALQSAMAAGTGGVGAALGAVAASRGADYGSLALMGNAATTVLGRPAGRGFVTGAGLAATRQLLRDESSVDPAAAAARPNPALAPSAPTAPAVKTAQAAPANASSPSTLRPTTSRRTLLPLNAQSKAPVSVAPLQDLLLGGQADLSSWTPQGAGRIRQAAAKLQPASPAVENAVVDLASAGHQTVQQWQDEGCSPVDGEDRLLPQFVDEVVAQAPEAAQSLVDEQAAANVPTTQRLRAGEAVALGVTLQSSSDSGKRTVPLPPRAQARSAAPAPAPTPNRPKPAPPPTATSDPQSAPDPELFDDLRAWRLETARQEGRKAFYVFPDSTLERIAAAQPQSLEELEAVKGVGPKKLAQYGPAVLDLTRHEAGKEDAE